MSSENEPGPPTDGAAPAPNPAQGVLSHRGLGWLPQGLPSERALVALCFGVCLLSLFGPIASAGIWEPYELDVAELSRRIAVNLLGADALRLSGANNSVPIVADLGRGELPFTSIALAFRFLGLHVWAGRLMLAAWGTLGVVGLYAVVARFSNRAAGAFSVLVLSTMPLYFLQSRTLLGEVVTMASITIASSGLLLAVFGGRTPRPLGTTARVGYLALALVGLGAGFFCRGLLIGVSTPLLGVGMTWLLLRPFLEPTVSETNGGETIGGAVCLFAGSVSLGLALYFLWQQSERGGAYSFWLGTSAKELNALPTHDVLLQQLGHALFPWSAVLPFLLGRALTQETWGAAAHERVLRVALVVISATAFALYSAQASMTDILPFGAVPFVAGIVGVGLADLRRGARYSRILAMGTIAFGILLYRDFINIPAKVFTPFGVGQVDFPDGFEARTHTLFGIATLVCLGFFGLSVAECPGRDARCFDRNEYLAWFRTLRTAFSGNLWFGVLALEAALVALRVIGVISDRWLKLAPFEYLGAQQRTLLDWAWLFFLPLVLIAPALALAARDAFRVIYERLLETRFGLASAHSRALGAVLSLGAFGALLSFSYYPALAAQLSPQDALSAFKAHARPGESLGLLGISANAARYSAGSEVDVLATPAAAVDWLLKGGARRWLVVRERDLGRLNSVYRSRVKPARNVPVLDAQSSAVYLVSSRIEGSEKNLNELETSVLDVRPSPSHKTDVELKGKLKVLGWDVFSGDGKVATSVTPSQSYEFVIYYEVGASPVGDWETFIHIDGFQRRYNGDHPTLGGKYPMQLWRTGDFIADRHTFSLEPNFSPGEYSVYFGMFKGEQRLSVQRGKHDEDRVRGGILVVR